MNPIKYSDFITPDDSIKNLIEQLTELISVQKTVSQQLEGNAQKLENTVRSTSAATEQEKDKLKEAALEAERLSKSHKQLFEAIGMVEGQIKELQLTQADMNKINKLSAQFNASVADSYDRLSAQYSLNKIALNKMSQGWRETTAEGQAFVNQANNIYQSMIKMQEATGKHTLSVGNYKKGWDGLGNSISQMTRELPNLAMGMNIFVLSLSNNIPIMVDEINRAIAANKEMIAANKELAAKGQELKEITPVWKQIGKSIFSFNTLIMVSVALLTIFSDKIFKWIESLIKGKDTYNKLLKEIEGVNQALLKGSQDSQKEIVRLNLLYRASTDASKGIHERRLAVQQLKKEFPTYFKDISNETILAGKAKSAYLALSNAIIASAKARASENAIIKNSEKKLEFESQLAPASLKLKIYAKDLERANAALLKAQSTVAYMSGNKSIAAGAENQVKAAKKAYNKQLEIVKSFQSAIRKVDIENQNLAANIKISDLVFGTKEERDTSYRDAKANLDLAKKQREVEVSLIRDDIQRRRQEVEAGYISELESLRNKNDNDKRVTREGREAIAQLEKSLLEKKNQDLYDLDIEEKKRLLKANEDFLQLSLNQVEKGGKEENDLKIRLLQNQKTQELLNNSELDESIRQSEYDINEKYNQLIKDQEEKYQDDLLKLQEDRINLSLSGIAEGSVKELELRLRLNEINRQREITENRRKAIDMRLSEKAINEKYNREAFTLISDTAMKEMDLKQQIAESEFNLIERTEEEKTIFRLKLERARYRKLLGLASQLGSQVPDKEKEIYENYIKAIDRELANVGVGKRSGLDLFGDIFGLSAEDKGLMSIAVDQLGSAINTAMGYINQYVQARIDAANKVVEATNKEVESAQRRYDLEQEARANGYASNVEYAQKELALAKKNQEQALKNQARAQQQQAKIESLSQSVSLITATANIWAAFTKGFGILGPIMAGIATAAMWGSFALAKIKAKQVTSQEYGEGGYEFLEGGSHASGKDIPLFESKGKVRKAEGGEFMGIVRKTATRKYRGILPDIINSLNKGIFEHKYINSFDYGGDIVQVQTDKIESDVRAIREQGEKKVYIKDGRMIKTYKNLTTKYV